MMCYYDREGKPISNKQWAELFEDMDYRRIGHTQISPEIFVSTVWHGIDHSFGRGPPVIFETMVFEGEREEIDCERYSTEPAAREGHDRMVARIKRRLRRSS